jgi:D-arabinose 1-dehydrogenase-like Zn-dependent alcohol dehydrogenase
VRTFGLEEANEALVLVKQGKIDAAAVLTMTR